MDKAFRARSWVMIMGLTSAVHAAPIYVDQFLTGSTPANGEYSTTGTLTGQNPSLANTSGAWVFTDAGGGTSTSVNFRATTTGLSGNGAAGGAAESFRTGTSTGSEVYILGRPAANNSDTTLTATETLYFSGLVSFAAGHRVGIGADFESRNAFGIGFDSDGQAGVFVASAATSPNGSPTFSAKFNNPSTNQPFAAGVTYLIVGRMLPNNGATADPESIEFLAINPTSTTEPSSPLATASLNVWGNASNTDTLDNFSLLASKSAGGVVATMDELRIGTAYADVVVVPEPGSLALVGLVGLVVGRRKR